MSYSLLEWETITGSSVYVCEDDGRVLGYYTLLEKLPQWQPDELPLEPNCISLVIGLHAVATTWQWV